MERSDDAKKTTAKNPTQTWAKEKVSALVDGEVEPDELRTMIAQLRAGDGRQAWDLYHEIGDAIRSIDAAPAVSAGFAQRFADRFAAEPVLLQPRRSLLARLGSWPTTMAAVAAAGFGFFVAPSLMQDAGPSLPAVANTAASTATNTTTTAATAAVTDSASMPAPASATMAATTAAVREPARAVPVDQVAQLAQLAPSAPVAPVASVASVATASRAAADGNDTLDYIALHHRAHASLYSAAPAIQAAVLEPASHR